MIKPGSDEEKEYIAYLLKKYGQQKESITEEDDQS